MFLRRLGNQQCAHGYSCPQILEKTDGNFVVVGRIVTGEAVKALPPGPGVGPSEGAVEVPRSVMLSSMADFFATAAA
jgi:hypothetical protein